MRCIQCLKLLWCQCQRECDGVFLYVRHRAGFGDCSDVTATDGPSERNGCCGATARCANTCKRGVRQQAGAGAAERRISHYRHTMLPAPWQQVTLNAAVTDAVRDLIGRAVISLWSMEQVRHVAGCKIGHAPRTNLSSPAQIFKRFHDAREVSDPISPVQQI